jgi:Winged helix DNA-binding domain
MTDYRDSAAVQIFGDSPAALARMHAAALGAGWRILGAAPVAAGPGAAATGPPDAALLIELDGGEGADTDAAIALLDWAEREAEAGRRRSVVAAPFALVDLVAARTAHRDVEQLCAPDEAARAAAIARVVRRPAPARLHDIGRDEDPALLRTLADEAGQVAAKLASLSATRGEEVAQGPAPLDAARIRAMIRARRLRDHFFRAELFADPAWDMLLDLLAARLEGRRVAVSSLCIAAAVPPTTALRWIKTLTERGLFVREADPADGRRVHVALSDEAAAALAACLGAIERLSPLAV